MTDKDVKILTKMMHKLAEHGMYDMAQDVSRAKNKLKQRLNDDWVESIIDNAKPTDNLS